MQQAKAETDADVSAAEVTKASSALLAMAGPVAADLDVELVQHLDRADTGASHGAPGLFGLSALLSQTAALEAWLALPSPVLLGYPPAAGAPPPQHHPPPQPQPPRR